MDRESAVQHLGYTSLNGASATALASLKQYGLAADAGTGMLRLTELALDILEPTSDETQRIALHAAAISPDLFAALRERFPDKPPSESNLRAHLVRQGFTTAALRSIVPSYLDTYEYVALLGASDNTTQNQDHARPTSPGQQEEGLTSRSGNEVQPNSLANVPVTGNRRMVFDTEEGEAIFTYPDGLSEASIDDLEAWFALVVKRLRRTSKQ